MSPIAVLGAGSWGTALAVHLARGGRAVRLWARDARLVDEMCERARTPRICPASRCRRRSCPVVDAWAR